MLGLAAAVAGVISGLAVVRVRAQVVDVDNVNEKIWEKVHFYAMRAQPVCTAVDNSFASLAGAEGGRTAQKTVKKKKEPPTDILRDPFLVALIVSFLIIINNIYACSRSSVLSATSLNDSQLYQPVPTQTVQKLQEHRRVHLALRPGTGWMFLESYPQKRAD